MEKSNCHVCNKEAENVWENERGAEIWLCEDCYQNMQDCTTVLPVSLDWSAEFANLPTRQTNGSAGLDLCSGENHSIRLDYGDPPKSVRTGVRVAIPEGHFGMVTGRSGLAFRYGIICHNGTIDQDYRGEIRLLLVNLGRESYTIRPGERIAQMIILPYIEALPVHVEKLDGTERGDGGFGSTGK